MLQPRLLIDSRPAIGGHGLRGIGRYVRGIAASISELAPDLRERIWAARWDDARDAAFGDRVVGLGASAARRPPWWPAGRRSVARALRVSGATVFHATDPQRPWDIPRTASIVTVYDLIPLREPDLLRAWRIDHRLAYRAYLARLDTAERIIAISRTTARDLQELLGVEPGRIDVVYPVVVAPPTVARRPSPEPTFLFVGALDEHKQPDLALAALQRFRRSEGRGGLRFIGPSEPDRVRTMREHAARLGVADHVTFEGRVPDADLERAFGSAWALLSTSRIEGFGLPGVEAVIRGIPVVAVRTPAATETLDGIAALVPPDAEAVAEAMMAPIEPSHFAVDALRRRFSVGACAAALETTYRGVLG